MDSPPTFHSLRKEADEYMKTYWEKYYDLDDFAKNIVLDMMAGFTLEKYVQLEQMAKNAKS